MTVAEREVCIVMAAVMHAHRSLADLGVLVTIVVTAAVTAATLLGVEIQILALLVALSVLLLGAVERYFAFRIRLDERLFSALGNGKLTSIANLDDALLQLDLIGKGRIARTLDARLKGAAGLCWKHRMLVVGQCAAAIAFSMLQTF